MVLSDLQRVLESWAPKELAFEGDNVGLQIGSPNKKIRKVLVALDVTDEVIAEAGRKKTDIIVTHHPLLFHPLRSVNTGNRVGRLVTALIRKEIALYSAHTNLDFTSGGVSHLLAKRLGLKDVHVLQKNGTSAKKVVVFVPETHADRVTGAMSDAGAGVIGTYDWCSFRTAGIGTFRGSTSARPYVGQRGKIEHVPEVRIEMRVQAWRVNDVLRAMKSTHPYEEAAFDIYDVSDESNHYGAGAVGNLTRPLSIGKFLEHIRRRLSVPAVRYSRITRKWIQRVAVCGGSGSDLLGDALREEADAFITSDVRFHTFQDADEKIALIDAGHFETEQPVVQAIVAYLRAAFIDQDNKITVEASKASRNVVQYSYS